MDSICPPSRLLIPPQRAFLPHSETPPTAFAHLFIYLAAGPIYNRYILNNNDEICVDLDVVHSRRLNLYSPPQWRLQLKLRSLVYESEYLLY